MHPPYTIKMKNPVDGSPVAAIIELFAGQFGHVATDGDDGTLTFTTPTRAIAINVVQVLVAEDVSFEYDSGE